MKTKKLDAVQVWKQIEDVLAPRLRLSVIDRSVYYHVVRQSRLEGRREIRFSIRSLARTVHVSDKGTRDAVRGARRPRGFAVCGTQ